MNRNVLGTYQNGNYYVTLFSDGTKVRFNKENYMRADRPESIDVCISKRCSQGCLYCYEGSTSDGAIADFESPLFDTIPPYTEIALNGNGIFNNIDFDAFLLKMSRQNVICNLTVHINDFIKHCSDLHYYVDHDWIHGIGVSINEPIGDGVISYLKQFPNLIVHVVAGIVPWETLVKLSNHGLKLLVLGYKDYGRGTTYLENHDVRANIDQLKNRIDYLYKHFEVVSFDNLALEQLDIRSTVDEDTWNVSYLGEDGSATFFIDAVANTYARSSISERIPIDIPDVNVLFRRIQNNEQKVFR